MSDAFGQSILKNIYTLKARQLGMSTVMYNQFKQIYGNNATNIVIDDFDDANLVDAPSKKDVWLDLEERLRSAG